MAHGARAFQLIDFLIFVFVPEPVFDNKHIRSCLASRLSVSRSGLLFVLISCFVLTVRFRSAVPVALDFELSILWALR